MSSTPESRFRAACDRCHELKNRCARRQGTDSRCERCERLELDCVYSTGARMGRPPGSQSRLQATGAKENNNNRSDRTSPSASRTTRGGAPATCRAGSSHGSQGPSSSPSTSRVANGGRPAAPAPKRHWHHHHRRRSVSNGISVGPGYSSNSQTMKLTPVESLSSSSGSGMQVPSSTLLSPLDSGPKEWLDAQDAVSAAGRGTDWDHEMTSLSLEHANMQWPNDTTTRNHETLFPGILEGHAPINSAPEDMPFLFQDPPDRQIMFPDTNPDTQSREQLVGAGSRIQVLMDITRHSISPHDRLMRLQDELRDLVTSQSLLFSRSNLGLGDPCQPRHHLRMGTQTRAPAGAGDDEAIQATLSLLTIVNELLLTPAVSGSTSPSSGEDYGTGRVADDTSTQGAKAFLHETAAHGLGLSPAFHANSSAESQAATLQVLNCYTYLLQLLDQVIHRLGDQIEKHQQQQLTVEPGTQFEEASRFDLTTSIGIDNGQQAAAGPSFQFGSVSLESFPALNSELVLFAMMRIIKRIHEMIDLLAFGRPLPAEGPSCPFDQQQRGHSNNTADPSRSGGDQSPTGALRRNQFSSPVIIAAQAVMTAVYERETSLVERMSALANGSRMP